MIIIYILKNSIYFTYINIVAKKSEVFFCYLIFIVNKNYKINFCIVITVLWYVSGLVRLIINANLLIKQSLLIIKKYKLKYLQLIIDLKYVITKKKEYLINKWSK